MRRSNDFPKKLLKHIKHLIDLSCAHTHTHPHTHTHARARVRINTLYTHNHAHTTQAQTHTHIYTHITHHITHTPTQTHTHTNTHSSENTIVAIFAGGKYCVGLSSFVLGTPRILVFSCGSNHQLDLYQEKFLERGKILYSTNKYCQVGIIHL